MMRPLLVLLVLFVPLVCTQALGIENGATIALFVSTVVLWFSELVPLAATGLLIPALAVSFGVADGRSAFAPFGNQILFLFLGSFFIARAMQKHGWDRRMAYAILASPLGGRSPATLVAAFAALAWLLSMWVSNTATCAMLAPIAVGIAETLRGSFSSEQQYRRFSLRLLLVCAFAASAGGMATPVGSPPNSLAIGFLGDRDIHISFVKWLGFALPVSLGMLVVLLTVLGLRYPLERIELAAAQAHFKEKLLALGPMTRAERQVGCCFALAVTLWIVPGLLVMIFPEREFFKLLSERLPMGAVAILASIPLFFLPLKEEEGGGMNLSWEDAGQIDWGTIMLFGGGLCMGAIISDSGLGQAIGEWLFSSCADNFLLAGSIAVVLSVLISEFSSNTASTVVVVPILLGFFTDLEGGQLTSLVVASAYGASFGFMLPVSTPPNAIVYGTGKVPLKEMIKTGVLFDISGALLIIAVVLVLFPNLGLF